VALDPDTLWRHLWKVMAAFTLLDAVLVVIALTNPDPEGVTVRLLLVLAEAALTVWLYVTRNNRPDAFKRR
jgi:hypothetical protein